MSWEDSTFAPMVVSMHVRPGTVIRAKTQVPADRKPYVVVDVGTAPAELALFVTSVADLDRLISALQAARADLARATAAEVRRPAGQLGTAWERHDDPEVSVTDDELADVAAAG